jgi:phosphatidylglycerol lysyltransferase
MKNVLYRIGPVLVVLVFCGAAWLLFHELRHYHIRDIRQALAAMPAWRLWASIGFTALNYLVLIGCDIIAIQAIKHPLPLGRIALASFTGFVTSYNFGALLGGTSIRYRLYSAWGLSAIEIVQLVVMLGLTFWMGIFALAGICFVVQPFAIPAKLHLPFGNVQPLGVILLVVTVAYLGATFLRKRPIRVRDTEVHLPRPWLTALQLAVAAADFTIGAAALYVLIAPGLSVGYGTFFGMYLLAVVATVITHVPGGVGVFELVVLTLVSPHTSSPTVAALLAFRFIYYLLPLGVALLLLIGNELSRRRAVAWRLWQDIGGWAGTVAPTLLAWTTFIAGSVLLFSGATPIMHARLGPLKHTIPLPLVEVSHFLGSLAGVGLLILARGLQRRLDSAWTLAMGLLSVGVVTSLIKGFDYEEALLLALIAATLLGCRRRFYRHGSLLHERLTPAWIAAVLLVVACTIWLGLFAYRHVEYDTELWWQFAFQSDASRFLRASVGVVAVLAFFAVRKLVSASRPRRVSPVPEDLEIAAAIVQASPRASAHLALLGDKSFLFTDDRTAFIMYGVQNRSWISMGDPVGPPAAQAELVWKFRELVDRYDGWPVFYQVGEQHLSMYLDQGLTLLKLGEEARVPLTTFGLEGSRRKGLRQTYNRGQREHLECLVVPREAVADWLPVLRAISDAWLANKHTSEKGFSLGFFNAAYLMRAPIAVVRQYGQALAFANMWCGADCEEISIDLMRYVPDSPASVMEYLFIELMLWGRAQGYRWFNLGMAPLSGIEARPLAPMWNRAVNLAFRYGEHFYSFEGLRAYKAKFDPVWSPKYLALPGGFTLPRILADVTLLISRRHDEVRAPESHLSKARS